MATENTTQINSFVTGLDCDSSIDRVAEGSYIMAKNLRVVQYDENNKIGSISPIPGIKFAGGLDQKVERILAAGTIRNYGVIIYISELNTKPELCVAKFTNMIGNGEDSGKEWHDIDPKVIFRSELIDWPIDKEEWPKSISISLKYEDEDDIKLYMATSFNPMIVINITEDYDAERNIDTQSSYPSVMFKKPVFKEYITGMMKPGLVSYSYQLYTKHGNATDISPACQQIPVFNTNKTNSTDVVKYEGINYGKTTNCGVKIVIPSITDLKLGAKFNRLRIFRLTVHQNGQVPTVEIIYDSIFDKDTEDFVFNDVGQDPIDTITPEEYNSMSGVHVIPNSIENKDQIMFAANCTQAQTMMDSDKFKDWDARAFSRNNNKMIVLQDIDNGELKTYNSISEIKDDKVGKDSYNPYTDINEQLADDYKKMCLYDDSGYYGGTGVNVSWRFVLTYIPIDTCEIDKDSLNIGTQYNIIKQESGLETPKAYFISKNGLEEANIPITDEPGRITESWLTKSLRRNELYRYGIILYDKTGTPSPVKWIADIRTPNLYDKYFNTFISHYKSQSGTIYDLASLPLGVAFNVQNLPEGCVGYEIVRCVRRESDIATISQGVVSKPIVKYLDPATKIKGDHTYFPTGLLTTAMVAQGGAFNYFWDDFNPGESIEDSAKVCATNFGNTRLLQFVSPEVVYQPESMKSVFKNKDFRIEPLRYLFGSSAIDLVDSKGKSIEYFSRKGNVAYKNFLRPGISNVNIFTEPGNLTSPTKPWQYYYYDADSNKVLNKEYVSDSYMLKMTAQYMWGCYYKAAPCAYKFSGSGSISQIIYDTLSPWSYVKPGKFTALTDAISGEDKGKIKDNVYGYIKLYEQAATVEAVRVDPDDNFKHQTVQAYSEISSDTTSAKINDIEVATSLQWDQILKMTFEEKGSNSNTKDNGRWWPQAEYKNHIDSIGQYQYCNAVMYGIDGAQLDKGGKLGDDPWTMINDLINGYSDGDRSISLDYNGVRANTEKGHVLNAPYATGGRCAVLQLDKMDVGSGVSQKLIFQNIVGANSYYKNVNNQLTYTNERCNYNGVNIESIAGTSLCNIRKHVTPYNGYSSEAKSTNVYYSTGQYFEANTGWNAVFDGDVVISVLDYTAMHKAACNFMKSVDSGSYKAGEQYELCSMMLGYAIPVESTINCRLSGGLEFSRTATNEHSTYLQVEPADIAGKYSQTEPEYVFNTAYAAEDKNRVHAAFDTENISDFNKKQDYRVYYSNLKENDEDIDSWTKFQSSNFLDVGTKYGPITNLRNFKDKLVFWQQKALGVLSVNERAITTDDNGNNIILGNGGVLSRYDYYDTTSGMHKQEFCDTQSTTSLYWFDHHNNEIKSLGESTVSLSKRLLIQSLLDNCKDKDQVPKLFFDAQNNEVINKVLKNKESVAFSEVLNKFTSIYDIEFDESLSFSNGFYLVRNDDGYLQVAQWDVDNKYTTTWDNVISSTYLKYVVNKAPITTKVFDNQEIVTPQDELELNGSGYFENNHNYTWATETQKTSSTLEDSITNREHNYRYCVPREDDEELYGSRMRGKYLVCSIEDELPNTSISIQYIITKFRTSWS